MGRDEILRALELLPAWQLRTSIEQKSTALKNSATPQSAAASLAKALLKNTAPQNTQVPLPSSSAKEVLATTNFRYLTCENAEWLFVLNEVDLSHEEQVLLANIFKAMQLKVKPATLTENIAEIVRSTKPKMLVSMGEAIAQTLLQSQETLENLRQKHHTFENVTLITTYDTAHLLLNLAAKANAWNDLCLAMRHMHKLKIEN